MGAPTDAELWRRAAAGNADAFGDLFERHARAVYNYCFRRIGDWSLAEDLTSIVFLEAWRRRKAVRLDGELALPWLLGVATNVLRNRRRWERRHRVAIGKLPREQGPDFAADADARIDDERDMRPVLERMAALPRKLQDALALCAWAGLTYEQAAVALGVPVGTVCSRVARARARLREPTAGSGHERDDPVVPAQEGACR